MIRHGKPTYENIDKLHLPTYVAELSAQGIEQAYNVSKDERLKDAEMIISSPFTRALQTASIIASVTGIPLTIETAFHEWLMDKTHSNTNTPEVRTAIYEEFLAHNFIHDESCKYNFESVTDIATRAYPAMRKYLDMGYSKVIIVAHSMLIRTFGYLYSDFECCGIYERDFDENSKFEGFVPWIKKQD